MMDKCKMARGWKLVTIAAASTVGIMLMSGTAQAGSLFVTGHDSDEHSNGDYMSAGLDFLLFGTASTPPARAGKTVALLDNSGGAGAVAALLGKGWGTVTLFDTDIPFAGAFVPGAFDAIMTASGGAVPLNTALLGATASFTSYLNGGGALYINTDQGFGQAWYDFVPSFGTTTNNTISAAGAFTPTAAGLGIGLTEAVVDADITHSFYTGVDTGLFTIFEVTDPASFFPDPGHPFPVAFGAGGLTIGGGGFGDGPVIPEPASLLLFGLGGLGAGLAHRRRKTV